MIIGIEGPAGAGKSTMARTVAGEIGAVVIEGGAWYRALTALALNNGISLTDTDQLVRLAENLHLQPLVGGNGDTRYQVGGQDITKTMYTEEVSSQVAVVAKQLEVRDKVDPQIDATVRSQDKVIVVGRHIKRALPEARVLRLIIDEAEVENRHLGRAGAEAIPVGQRNAADEAIGQMLGVTDDGVTLVDVTHMNTEEQAEELRQFIASQVDS